ncbi:hypothetical protein EBT31_09915 [bacterium]|nr:hypothetical protein [bacterium]
MDRHSEVDDNQIAEFTLTDDEMILILKGLDIYGYSLIMSENVPELLLVKNIVTKILAQLPKPELNS